MSGTPLLLSSAGTLRGSEAHHLLGLGLLDGGGSQPPDHLSSVMLSYYLYMEKEITGLLSVILIRQVMLNA